MCITGINTCLVDVVAIAGVASVRGAVDSGGCWIANRVSGRVIVRVGHCLAKRLTTLSYGGFGGIATTSSSIMCLVVSACCLLLVACILQFVVSVGGLMCIIVVVWLRTGGLGLGLRACNEFFDFGNGA